MKKQSFQQIEDSYVSLGYKEEGLRKALAEDKEYQKLLRERRQRLTKQLKLTSPEKRKYVLSVDTDFEILAKCKQLENRKLTKEDKLLVKVIKTQLESDWRKPLLRILNYLLRKYK